MSIRRNTTYNLLGSIIPLVVSLITIPVYMRLIGEARYGVLAIAWLLLGYFGLFDLGLGRATAQRIAAQCDNTTTERAKTFWTALTLNLGLGVIGGLLIWPFAVYFFGSVFKIDDVLRPEMQAAVPWLILAVPMATLSGVLSGALKGRERFLDLNLISVFGTVLFQLLPLTVAILWSANLSMLLPVSLFARLITLVIMFQRCSKYVFLTHKPSFDRSQAGKLLRFGGWVTVTSFIGPMMVILDRFVIGALVGAKAVTYYTVPFQLGQRSTVVPNALTSALFPRLASSGPKEATHLAFESLRSLLVVMTPIIAIAILCIEPFFSWWVGSEFAGESVLIGQVLLLGFWVNGFAQIPYAHLQASGRPDLVAKCHLYEVLPYFLLLYFGLQLYGLLGAAVAFSLRVAVDFLFLTHLAGGLRYSLRVLIFPFLLLTTAFLISNLFDYGYVLLILAAVHLLVTISWACCHAPEVIKLLVREQFNKFCNIFLRS